MSKEQKLKERIKSLPTDYTFTEAKSLLTHLGFHEYNKGKTSGSRVKFYRECDNKVILLHKPHPGNEMKKYAVKELYLFLKGIGDI